MAAVGPPQVGHHHNVHVQCLSIGLVAKFTARTIAALILMACRECPVFGPVVPVEVDNLRRLSHLRKVSNPADART